MVTDSASNMIKAFNLPGFDESAEEEEGEEEDPEEGDPEDGQPSPFQPNFLQIIENMTATYITENNLHMRCPIHLLQLALKDAINSHADVGNVITRTAKLVKAVRKSTLNTEEADKLGVRPTQACITRWSSQLRMIESVLKMFERDSQFQNKMTIPENSKLTTNDVLQLQALTEVLSPLAELTNAMQKELGNLGIILPAVMEIKPLLSSLPETLPLPIRAFAETLSDNVSSRFKRFYSDKHLVLAAVLDPRFKTEWIIRDGTVSNRLAEIRELLVKEAECSGVDTVTEARSAPKKVRSQLRFWKTSAGSLPRLAKVARKIFSIPSGSSSAERVFSAAGLRSRAHRMSLKPDTLSKLMFLKIKSKIL